jgi:hypothetical protein
MRGVQLILASHLDGWMFSAGLDLERPILLHVVHQSPTMLYETTLLPSSQPEYVRTIGLM